MSPFHMVPGDTPLCQHKDTAPVRVWKTRTRDTALGPAGSRYSVVVRPGAPCGAPALLSRDGHRVCSRHLRSL